MDYALVVQKWLALYISPIDESIKLLGHHVLVLTVYYIFMSWVINHFLIHWLSLLWKSAEGKTYLSKQLNNNFMVFPTGFVWFPKIYSKMQ
jgi:hypothetical protein